MKKYNVWAIIEEDENGICFTDGEPALLGEFETPEAAEDFLAGLNVSPEGEDTPTNLTELGPTGPDFRR